MRIALAVLAVAGSMQLSANWSVSNADSPKRVVTITAHTPARATCSLSDSVSGVHLSTTASAGGRAVWRWRPSVWANGPDTVTVNCAKGRSRGSTEAFFLLGALEQIGVIRHYALHLVFWAPKGDMPPAVPRAAEQLETDVQATLAAGATDNPFAIPRAYVDSLGPGDPRIASIDASNDRDPYPSPARGFCRPSAKPCLAAAEVGAEVTRIARQRHWAAGNHTLVLMITSPSLAVCFTRPGTLCSAKSEVCGYHALTNGGYAYGEVIMSAMNAGCGALTPADYAVSIIGHEQNEAIVDPWGSTAEVGDPCDDKTKLIGINGHKYYLQALLEHGHCAFAYTP